MKRRFVLDFGETITTSGSTEATLRAGIALNKNLPSNVTYDRIISEYDAIYNLNLTDPSYKKLKKKGTTANYQAEYEYQAAMDPYEVYSLTNIKNLTVFDGVNVKDFVDMVAPTVDVRTGFYQFLERVELSRLFILSLNFSADLISHFVPGLPMESIFCDSFISVNGTYTGALEGGILTGSDKCNKLFELGQKKGEELWYVGDSHTDYLSVLHPYVQESFIIIDTDSAKKMQKACTFFNMTTCEYGDITDQLVEQAWLPTTTKNKHVHLVSSWYEIMERL